MFYVFGCRLGCVSLASFHILENGIFLGNKLCVDRDCARWKLPPAEVQKRRALFWELFITDCWQVSSTSSCLLFC